MSHFIPPQPLGRARHALPHSLGRSREPGPGAGGAGGAPRNLGAADAARAAQILLLVAALTSAEQPPRATSGPPNDPRSRPGRPAGSPARGQRRSAPGGSCRRGWWLGLGAGAALRSAPRRAPHCSRQRGSGGAGGGRDRGPEPRG